MGNIHQQSVWFGTVNTQLTNELNQVVYYYTLNIGQLNYVIAETDNGLCYIGFVTPDHSVQTQLDTFYKRFKLDPKWVQLANLTINPLQSNTINALLTAYLDGNPCKTTLNLHLVGSINQHRCWQALLNINSGQTFSYGQLSQQLLGDTKGARAVGNWVGQNPVSLLIPCHRILAANGKIGGYYWGSEVKVKLLAIERSA